MIKDTIQWAYSQALRRFEDYFGPSTMAAYLPHSQKMANFSREIQFPVRAKHYIEPKTEAEIQKIVKAAIGENVGVRVIGSGHSFNNITEPSAGGYVINLAPHFNKVVAIKKLEKAEKDPHGGLPVVAYGTVQGGMKLRYLCYELAKLGYGVHNMGNYYEQTVAGVVSTGTHGTTGRVRADTFTSIVVRLKIINGKGEIKYIEGGADSITLGALGVVTEVTIKLVPMYWLKHSVEVVPDIVSACSISNIRKLLSENDFAFFRWSTVNGTRKSCAKRAHVETFNITSKSQITPLRNTVSQLQLILKYYLLANKFNDLNLRIKQIFLFLGTLLPKYNVDAYYLAYAVPGVVARHIESEWALPIENTQEAVKWISENMEEAFGNNAFEVHVRFVPADGAHLSPAHGRETVYIDINITVTIGYSLEPFYTKMKELGGKPHWSKLHDLTASEIRPLYNFKSFDRLRREHDPQNVFGSAPYIRRVLGPPGGPLPILNGSPH